MATLANIKPPTKANKITMKKRGLKGRPSAAIATKTTVITTVAFMVARVAPQTISPQS